MSEHVDRDLLADYLKSKMRAEGLSIRAAAKQVGCSAATLGRLLKGSEAPNYPEGENLVKASSWVGKSLEHFMDPETRQPSTLADVEAHLRALPELPEDAAEGIVAMVRSLYDARRLSKKGKEEG